MVKRTDSKEPHPVLQLLAVLASPQTKAALLATIKSLRGHDEGPDPFEVKALSNVLALAVKNQWVTQTGGRYLCNPDYALTAFKAAVRSGRLKRWSSRLLKQLGVVNADGRVPSNFGFESKRSYGLRIAVYTGQTSLFHELSHRHGCDEPLELATTFDGYADAELLDTLPQEFAADLAAQLLDHGLENPNVRNAPVLDWALAHCNSDLAPLRLRLAVIQQLAWRGRLEQMASVVGVHASAASLQQAMTVVMQGHYAQALPLFERVAASLPPGPDGKRGRLPFVSTWLQVLAMIAADDPTMLEAAATVSRKLVRSAGGRWLWNSVLSVIASRSGDAKRAAWFTISGSNLLDDLTQAIAYTWMRQRPDTTYSQGYIEHWATTCEQTGYVWPARELRACLAIWSKRQPAESLAAAFMQERNWQRALAALSALRTEGRESEAEQTRLTWLVRPQQDGVVAHIEPWEQKRSNKGWSRGRKLALSALVRNEALLPQDARVAQAVRPSQGNGYELDVNRALRALIGHSLVFFEDDWTTPVELTLTEPELVVTRDDAGARLTLQPSAAQMLAAFEAASEATSAKAFTDPCVIRRDAAHSAQVIVLSATHRRIARLLGDAMSVPAEGAEQLRAALSNAAGHFAVLDAHTVADVLAAGDATLRAELSPRGSGLRMQLVVRPFGSQGPRYTPARGSDRVFAKIEGEPRAVLRNLDAERAAVNRVSAALEMFALEPDTLQLNCEQPARCLELLEVLQGLTECLQIDWPAGVKYRISRAYGVEDLQVAVGRQRDWFTADGGLRLDDGTVLELRALLDAARAGHGRFVPLGEAGFLALSETLARRLNDLALLDESNSGAAKLALTAALALGDVTAGAQLQGSAEWQQAVQRIQESLALEPQPPTTLQAELRSYQIDGFQWLARLAHWGGGACLADDMGLGKTLQALALLLHRAPLGPALVVAPTSVCQNWLDEARRFTPTLRAQWFVGANRTGLLESAGPFDVIVCSYTLLQQEIESFQQKSWYSVVLDEAQAVKNFSTKRAQAVLALQADFRLAVTGTPVENRLEELWMVFRFLNPGLLGSREHFIERFATPIERANDPDKRAALRRLIAPFILRRTKSEVLTELPPRTEITLSVEPEAEENAFHEALRQNALAALADSTVPPQQRRFRILTELMRVRRACCHPQLIAPDATVGSAKLKAFADLAAELIANRHKALVFSQFVDYLSMLRAQLDSMGVRYQYLDGSTPATERTQRVQAFQSGEGELFLISLRAGGVGLNLTAADYVIITDPWWNPAVEDQAASRAHRMGQERPVTVYRLVIKGSIEERIMQLHGEKRALAEGLFSGEEFGGAWSVEDLMQLLRVAQ